MNNIAIPTTVRWTENELEREINTLEVKLCSRTDTDRPAGRHCAQAYLRQVLKDRRATLRLLRFRDRQTTRPVQSTTPMPMAAPPRPRPMPAFQPLLRV